MTRGKIIYIDEKLTYISTEFNGDMYPQMRKGKEIVDEFKNNRLNSVENYTSFLYDFNNKYFNYPEDLFHLYDIQNYIIDISNNWTDYLYIINQSNDIYKIKTKEGNEIELLPNKMAICDFQKFVEYVEPLEIIENKLLSKEDFIYYLNELKEDEDFYNALANVCKNRQDCIDIYPKTMLHFVDLLQKLMNDENDYIFKWCYEYEYGLKDMYINKELIKTSEDLYNILVK